MRSSMECSTYKWKPIHDHSSLAGCPLIRNSKIKDRTHQCSSYWIWKWIYWRYKRGRVAYFSTNLDENKMTIFCTYNLGDEVKRENLKTNQSNSNWTKASITADKKSRTYTKTEEILDGISFNLAQEIYNPDMRLEWLTTSKETTSLATARPVTMLDEEVGSPARAAWDSEGQLEYYVDGHWYNDVKMITLLKRADSEGSLFTACWRCQKRPSRVCPRFGVTVLC